MQGINGVIHGRDTKQVEKNCRGGRLIVIGSLRIAIFVYTRVILIDAISRKILPNHATLRRGTDVLVFSLFSSLRRLVFDRVPAIQYLTFYSEPVFSALFRFISFHLSEKIVSNEDERLVQYE